VGKNKEKVNGKGAEKQAERKDKRRRSRKLGKGAEL